MKYTSLGRTSLDVGVIGIGTEHLKGHPRETVVPVVRKAIELGVNYFDLIFAFPDYLDNLQVAFQGIREQLVLTSHLGSTVKNGQYFKSRSPKRCETFFHDFLAGIGTDYVDILFLHNFNSLADWDRITAAGGVLELAQRLRGEGKARFIGISGHYPGVMAQAIDSGVVDVVMFPVNLFNHAMAGRNELLDLCLHREVGVVAMKPFGGGRLLTARGTYRVPKYQTGGQSYQAKITTNPTPVQCLGYVLSQVGVSMALPGVKSTTELAAALGVLEAAEAERDFGALLAGFGRYVEGECVYCNHCLPCPAVIDIGQINRLLDRAQWGMSSSLQSAYEALPVPASACTDCGVCESRCPFGVEVMVRMRQASATFEAQQSR